MSRTAKIALVVIAAVIVGATMLVFSNFYAVGDDKKQPVQQQTSPSSSSSVVIVGPANIADMVEKVSPAVVNIETSVAVENSENDYFLNDPFFRQFFGDNFLKPRQNIQKGIGTGFIIDPKGYVVTNQHVIDKASQITVNMSDDKKYPAKVVGQDYELDLAVLKIQPDEKLVSLKMGDSDKLRVGEWVIAIGNPYGLDHTVTAGLVSAKGRPIQIQNRVYKNLIQTDAAINPGNSGGPLLNTKGEVVAINTAVNSQAQGIGFAIPINTAKDVLNELIEKGKVIRPYIGIYQQTVTSDLADYLGIPTEGVVVVSVVPGGPAEKAGVKKYDVIVTIDDQQVKDSDGLHEILKNKQVKDKVVLEVLRNGQHILIPVILAEKP